MLYVYTLVLILGTICLASILWSTVRYGIGPLPSSPESREAMLTLVPEPAPERILELGSGWGGLALQLAERFPDSRVQGYERSLIPFLYAKLLVRRENLSFHFEDFRGVELPPGSLLVAFLAPRVMQELSKHPGLAGCQLISHSFALPGQQPAAERTVADMYRSPIYLYRLG
jgi:hypothetical protein